MSIDQLDDSEFLIHVAWLMDRHRLAPLDVTKRLQAMADTKPAFISSADFRSHLPGDDLCVNGPNVAVRMSLRGAQDLSHSLSDLLCWCRGFVAAIPEDLSRHPMNWEAAREINIALKRVIEEVEKEQQP